MWFLKNKGDSSQVFKQSNKDRKEADLKELKERKLIRDYNQKEVPEKEANN